MMQIQNNIWKDFDKIDLVVAEYQSLRDEIMLRIKIRQNIISITLLIMCALLSAGLQEGINSAIIFIYPIISFFLVVSLVYNDLRIDKLAEYLISLEDTVEVINWTNYIQSHLKEDKTSRLFGPLSIAGIFIITQTITVYIAYHIISSFMDNTNLYLLIISILFIFLTVILSFKFKGWKK